MNLVLVHSLLTLLHLAGYTLMKIFCSKYKYVLARVLHCLLTKVAQI